MHCPKCRKIELKDSLLSDELEVKSCQECKGNWIPTEHYQGWKAKQPKTAIAVRTLTQKLDVDFVQSPYDAKAALCPNCGKYLSRAKVSLNTPFYVERCNDCGIWCDHGEWEILTQLGLSNTIEKLFSREWQAKVQKAQHYHKERQALVEKIGSELAQEIFALAEVLKDHPQGDFALAYMMRRVGESKKQKE